jgi:hypothetical protein
MYNENEMEKCSPKPRCNIEIGAKIMLNSGENREFFYICFVLTL